MPASTLTSNNRPKSATAFFYFALPASVLITLVPLLRIWFDGPIQPLLGISVAGVVMGVSAWANWRWWVPTSWRDTKGWAILALEALPATAMSALIVFPTDGLGYLWVLLVFFVGLLTANITTVVQRAKG